MAHRTGIISKDGSRVHIFPNGGPADTTRDCICCGNEPPPIVDWPGIRYMTNNPPNYGPAFGIARSDGAPSAIHTCFSGCCACTSVASSLDFHMHSCKTITVLQQPSYFPSWDGSIESECTNTDGAYPMTFTLQKRVTECYGTQFFANNPSVTQNYRNDRNIHWNAFAENFGGSNFQACTTWPPEAGSYWYLPVEDSTTEYTDEDPAIKNTDYYPEAWGFSGNVCGGTTTPSRPGYSYPGSCGGQAIVASLCCCKTGTESIERIGGYDKSYLRSCPKWSIKWPHIQPVPEAHRQEDTDDRVDCSMGCFSFTIQPDHKYRHDFKVLAQNSYNSDWYLDDAHMYTSCSPCVYKQGECDTAIRFNPSRIGDIAMDVGTMQPLHGQQPPTFNYDRMIPGNEHESLQYSNTNTVWNGQNFLISGQCNDGMTGSKKMRLIYGGAYITHCDCQTGVYTKDYSYYAGSDYSVCYGDKYFYGTMDVWPYDRIYNQLECYDEASCNSCLEVEVIPEERRVVQGRILYGAGRFDLPPPWSNQSQYGYNHYDGIAQPCTGLYGGRPVQNPWDPPYPPGGYLAPPDYPCGSMADRALIVPNQGQTSGIPWRLPAEIDPEDWDTAEGSPFGTNPWFHGGRDKNGTNPDENSWDDAYKWAFLYCREDAENDETCGSICEHVIPAIMWYTGIIEES